ncbi:SDR family NAD(P)-dependent oxidoreductase [Prescottella sp. R16]|uniref:SDR family NAD(P)-dependent oxidoreductase n=1 Tax=Prescottella sp. R16 TaxID=3064529 RepID=UPI00272E5309|nr:SDR family NAD(P)-dependent oxidoreductase [Prescottella sp. R16]
MGNPVIVDVARSPIGRRAVALVADVDVWDRVRRVDLRGTFLMSRACARSMVERGAGGCIVNISSVDGKPSGANSSAYSASKAAIQSLTSSMAKELGPSGIRVGGCVEAVRGSEHSSAPCR